MVRCFAQEGSEHKDFDFTGLPVAAGMQREMAVAFARRTAPGSRLTSMHSIRAVFQAITTFATYLANLPAPPRLIDDLVPGHIDGFVAHRRGMRNAATELGSVKGVLLGADGITDALVAKLRERNPHRRVAGPPTASYSSAEFKRIATAAREDLRAAAVRIRNNRQLLREYREGSSADPERRMELLDFVDRYADVPRYKYMRSRTGAVTSQAKDWVRRLGSTVDAVAQLHLVGRELVAGAILLAAMTGQNRSVILNAGVAHHRADGHVGQTAAAILNTRKPRRGGRAYMNLVLEEVPNWISIPDRHEELSARDELHTPFGVYALMIELTARSREFIGTDKLFVGYTSTAGGHCENGRGLRVMDKLDSWYAGWSRSHNLVSDAMSGEGNPVALQVAMNRVRLTYLELHQKPVAHREQTLVKDYLSRNRGSVDEYRRVVAEALAGEVDRARARGVIDHLSIDDLARAHDDPDGVAAEHGMDARVLERMMARKLDTVMAACADDGTGPHTAAGACQASFMQCLSCPCARAMPHHLPIQVHVHSQLGARKAQMDPLTWVERFGFAHAQLAELLARHDLADVDDARVGVSDADRALVERFLNRELDLR
ncbi:hypothetical protein HGB38_27435 [Nocardia gamkensis]|uniref:Uncharacterized protein n=1 Tax=Nocardia gamkensis TaxID=352869 RepID=A0A7X6L8Y6_9NOCA|nr:hypothetical protein [Nocardia gamkensis]